MKNVRVRLIIIAAVCLAFALFVYGNAYAYSHGIKVVEVRVFNLSGRQSVFIRTADDRRYVIGGGKGSDVVRHITRALPFFSRRIDGVISTGVNPNDVGGLIRILERYDVGSVYLPAVDVYSIGLASSTVDAYHVFREAVKDWEKQSGKNVQLLMAGNVIDLSGDGSTRLHVLFPLATSSFEYSKASSPSLVWCLSMSYSGNNRRGASENSVISLGYSTPKIQKALELQHADVLIVSNGASDSQISQRALDMIRPRKLIYSQNENSADNTSRSGKKSTSIAGILKKDRFNVREGVVKIFLGGDGLVVEQIRD